MVLKILQGGLPQQRHRVLVVEDEALIRLSVALHLQDNNFHVREASSAAEAVAVLVEPDCFIDLVLSDVRMPGAMDGLGLSRWVFENRPNIPVILVTGDMDRMAALQNRFGAEILSKPYNFDNAVATIRNAIARKRE